MNIIFVNNKDRSVIVCLLSENLKHSFLFCKKCIHVFRFVCFFSTFLFIFQLKAKTVLSQWRKKLETEKFAKKNLNLKKKSYWKGVIIFLLSSSPLVFMVSFRSINRYSKCLSEFLLRSSAHTKTGLIRKRRKNKRSRPLSRARLFLCAYQVSGCNTVLTHSGGRATWFKGVVG